MPQTAASARTARSRANSLLRAGGWGASLFLVAVLVVLGARAGGLPLPFPGAVFVLAAVVATYGGGAGAGLVATLLTMLATSAASTPLLDWLPHGRQATAVLALSQLTATAFVGLMQRRLELAVRRQLQSEADAREAVALFHAEQTLRLVVDNIPQRVFWKDREGRYLGCNTAFARDAGFAAPAEVIGKNDFDMAWKEDAAVYRADDAAVVAGHGAKIGYEEPQHQPDGSVMWLRTSKVPMLDENGAIAGVLGTYEDITEQRRRELALRIASNAQEFALEAVVTLDLSHRIVSVNRAFTAMTGYSAAEVIGRDQAFLRSDRHPPEFYERIWETTARTGRWQGELWRRHRDGHMHLVQASFSEVRDDAGLPTHHVMVFNDISQARADAERAAWLAYHDPLTGLSNRVAFAEAIRRAMARAERDQSCVAVLYVDLDGFKPVNDSLGHAAGDELLRQVAARLSAAVRRTDRVARLGGDEFSILLERLADASQSIALADKLLELLAKVYVVSGYELFVGASIGISIASGGSETSGEELLKNADLAMFEAKRKGKGRSHVFSHNLDARARRTLALTNQLHQALERDELSLCYQPKLALRDRRTLGFEALLRWHNAELGQVSPADFIPVAENTGLIDPIGEWVLLAACRQAREWSGQAPGLVICVNVSARQLRNARFTQQLEEILRATGLPPAQLELEITESMVIAEPEQAIEVLLRIREMGVGVVLDDFGTGYSSLSYLQRLPVDRLKIDRSFIQHLPDNEGDASLVRGILSLARTLGIGVVAEGVETPGQLAFLREAGCEAAQGYLLARPMSAGDAVSWLSSEHARRHAAGSGGAERVTSDSAPDIGGAGTRSSVG